MKLGYRFAAVLVAALMGAGGALGQGWPAKPVRIIVPFTGGSATDILARTFGQ
jgi:tripartite-type tricarboxylate transporter receptor subunit TctC